MAKLQVDTQPYDDNMYQMQRGRRYPPLKVDGYTITQTQDLPRDMMIYSVVDPHGNATTIKLTGQYVSELGLTADTIAHHVIDRAAEQLGQPRYLMRFCVECERDTFMDPGDYLCWDCRKAMDL